MWSPIGYWLRLGWVQKLVVVSQVYTVLLYVFHVSSVGWGHLSWEHMFNMNYYHVVLCDSGATHFCTLKLMMKPLAASLFMWKPAVLACKHLRLVSSVSPQTVSSKQDCQPGYHFMRVPVPSPSCTKVGCAYYCIITYYLALFVTHTTEYPIFCWVIWFSYRYTPTHLKIVHLFLLLSLRREKENY